MWPLPMMHYPPYRDPLNPRKQTHPTDTDRPHPPDRDPSPPGQRPLDRHPLGESPGQKSLRTGQQAWDPTPPPPYLYIDEHTVVCLVQLFVPFRFNRKFKWYFRFARRKSPRFRHFKRIVQQLDWLQTASKRTDSKRLRISLRRDEWKTSVWTEPNPLWGFLYIRAKAIFFISVADYNELPSSFLYEPIWKRCRFRSRCEWALRLIYITVA